MKKMGNTFKRFLALALAVFMVVGMMPTNIAFATEDEGEATTCEHGNVASECETCNPPADPSEEPSEDDTTTCEHGNVASECATCNPPADPSEEPSEDPSEDPDAGVSPAADEGGENQGPITGTITEDMVWNDGDVIGGVTIAGNVTITVNGTVTVTGTIRLNPDVISNVVFNGENGAMLIRGNDFTGQMFYAEGVSGNFQNLTFNNITLDGGAVWTGDVDATLNRGTTNSGVKATGSVLYLVYANADLNNSTLQNHDDSTGEKANAVFLRYYSTIDFNNSVVRNNNSISTYYRGGVITVRQGGTVKTNNAEVYGNSGKKGGFYGTSSTGSFGGIVEVTNSKFRNNRADNGAVFDMQCNSNKGYLKIDGCEFYKNASGQGLIYEHAFSRPVIIKDSYFHDNECAVWDCHADPVLDISGKIVITEDEDYTNYLFETPLVLTGALAEGSSIAMSEASITKLVGSAGYIATGTADYAVTEADMAKFVLPEGKKLITVDVNFDGILDVVPVADDFEKTEIKVTLKDSKNESAAETRTVYANIAYKYNCDAAYTGFVFTGWLKSTDNKTSTAIMAFEADATLTAQWKLANPAVTVSRKDEGANINTLVATVTNQGEGITYAYQWYKDGTTIEGATSAEYTIDATATYKCEVTASLDGYKNATGKKEVTAELMEVPKNYVAQVGETKYESLQAAVEAAKPAGDTITVIADHELTWDGETYVDGSLAAMVVVEGKAVTIDLNGHALTGSSNTNEKLYAAFAAYGGGSLTLVDGKNTGSVTVTGDSAAYSLLMAYDPVDKLTVKGGTYYLQNASDSLIFCGGKSESAYVEDGTFTLGNVGTGENGKPWIFNVVGAGDNHVNVTGGTFNANVQRQHWANEVMVSTDCYIVDNGNGTWTVKEGATLYAIEGALTAGFYIEDWSIGYPNLEAFIAAANANAEDTTDLYDPLVLAGDPSDYKAEGYKLVDNKDGTWTVVEYVEPVAMIGDVEYGSIQAAVEAAKPAGDTITVIADHEMDCGNPVTNSDGFSALVNVAGKAVTIDLNGKTITVSPKAEQFTDAEGAMLMSVFAVDTDGTLTLKDSVGTGKVAVTANDANVYSLAVCYGEGGKLNIESGSYTADAVSSALIYSQHDEVVTITGGNFHLGNVGTGSNGSPWIFNANGQNTQNIIVVGGTYNADIFHQFYIFEVKDTTEVAELLNVPVKAAKDKGDGTWTVVDAVAYVDEQHKSGNWYTQNTGYATLEEAIAASGKYANAGLGYTVTLVDDAEVTGNVTVPETTTLVCGDYSVVLAAADATLTAPEDLNVTTNVANGKVVCENGTHKVVVSTPVAEVNGVQYESLAEAVAAANAIEGGATVTLLADVALDEMLTISGNVTIEGAYTITWADGYTGTLINVDSGASVKLKNLTIDGENAFTFYDDTTTVENGQNWYTRFVNVGEEDKAVNADVIVNAGNLTLMGVTIKNVTIASDNANGKTENTETGYVLKYNDDLAIIKSNGGSVVITDNGSSTKNTKISGNAGLVLNAINANTQIIGNSDIEKNMGCGNKGGIIIANGGTMEISGASGIDVNKAMARSATILGVINGAEVTFGGLVDYGGDELYDDGTSMSYNKHIGVGSNTAGAMIVLEGASRFVMNGGTIWDNAGGRAGAIASRWVGGNYGQHEETSIVLNAGSIKRNTASNDSWNGASIFLRSPATIGEGMTIDGTIAVNAAPGALEITGGTFNGKLIVTDGLTAEITGGTFNYDPSEYVAEGYEAVKNDDGTWTVQEFDYVMWVKEQLLAGNGVTLDRDIVVDGSYVESIPDPVNGNGKYPNYGIFNVYGDTVTIDLNGFDVTYKGHASFEWNGKTYNSCTVAHGLFFANAGANLTIKDSKGTSDITVYGLASGAYAAAPNTVLTVEGGNWKNEGCAECGGTNIFLYPLQGATLNITGGTFEQALDSEGESYLIVEHGGEYKGSTIDYSLTNVEITGGTFVGMNPAEIKYFQQTADNKLVMGETTDGCAKGYKSEQNEDGTWTVVPNMIFKLHIIDPNTNEPATIPYIEGNDLASVVAQGKYFYANYYNMVLEILGDWELDEGVVIDYPMTIDLCGNTLTTTDDVNPAIRVLADVTVKNGKMNTAGYCFIVGNGDGVSGNLTIESGSYTGLTTVASVTKGTLTVAGGTFATSEGDYGATYLLNCIDANYKDGSAVINVTGGTFVGFNPEDNAAEGAGTNFVAKGYKSEQNEDGTWTVVPNMIFEMHLVDANGEAHWLSPMRSNDLNDVIEKSKIWYDSLQGTYDFTLKVLESYELDETVLATFPMTIDLCENTLTVAETMNATPAIRVLSDVTVTNGTVDATAGTSTYAFIVGNSTTAGTLTIVDGTYKGRVSVASVTKGTLNISGGNFESTEYNGAYEFQLNCIDANYKDGSAVINVTGGTFVGFNPEDNAAEGAGTNFCAKDYGAFANEEGTEWTVEQAKFYIYTWDDLKKLDKMVEAGDMFEGKTVYLMNDINLYEMGEDGEPVTFNPIGANKAYFKGTFDGQGHTIKNMYQSGWALGYDWYNYGSIGLFAYLWDATVKDLTIENSECFVEGGNVGGIAGCAWGDCTFENITIKNSKLATYNNRAGGIVGYTGGEGTFTFKNVTVDENTVIAGLWGSFDSSLGGVMGQLQAESEVVFEKVNVACRIDAYNDVTASYKYYAYRMCGMIAGMVPVDENNKPILDNVTIVDNSVYVNFGDWAKYTYINNNANGYGWQRVEAGYTYGGVDIDDYPDANIEYLPFTSLFGGQQYGCYGISEFAGVNVNFVPDAAIGETKYWTLADALEAAKDGDVVTLLKDVTVCDEIVVKEKNVTLDLNEKTVTGLRVLPVIRVQEGANVTVKNGNIVNEEGYCFILGASDSTSAGNLTIESGSYTGLTSVASVTKGTLTITGGTFATAEGEYGATYLLNCIDANVKDGTAKIVVKGGTFVGFNPEDNAAENPKVNFCADGYEAVDNGDNTWTVQEKKGLVGSIRIRSAALNMLDKVCIVYKASDDLVTTNDSDVADRGILLYKSEELALSKDPSLAYETVQLIWDETEQRYIGQSEGIDARDMDQSQFAVAYLQMIDGTYIFGTKEGADHIVEMSPLIYCNAMKNSNDPDVANACAAMMQYGAAAQVEQYGKTTGLMNEGFKAIPYDANVLGESVYSVERGSINGMQLRTFTMDLKGAVSYIVRISVEDESIADKKFFAEYTLRGTTDSVEMVAGLDKDYPERLTATIAGIAPKDLDASLSVKAYYLNDNGEKVYGGELVCSGYEYVRRAQDANFTEEVKALSRALAMYIHYADIYAKNH